MKRLRATPSPRGWVLRTSKTGIGADGLREHLAEAIGRGRDRLLAWFRSEASLSEAWRLEAAKAAIDDGEIVLGLAELLADRCQISPDVAHEIGVPGIGDVQHAVGAALRARGMRVAGRGPSRVWRRLRVASSACVGVVVGMVMMVRHGRPGPRLAAGQRLVFALHGESSTRTRHLLALVGQPGGPTAILVLGRPRIALAELRRRWEREFGPMPVLIRPFSWSSALRSLPEALGELARGVAAAPAFPWLPSRRARFAQAWRILLGTASARWWRDQAARVDTVAFGHTGTADTHLLERAIQRSGARTVHVVHGLSGGLNFVGYSDVALWRCGADAAWHRSLGTYGVCTHAPASIPDQVGPGADIVALTNLAHPMNPLYRFWGVGPECEVLAEMARIATAAADAVQWRPHPVFGELPLDGQRAVNRAAAEAGFRRLGPEVPPASAIRGAGRVLCTPSTVIVDVLKAGRCPEIVGDRRWASHVALRAIDVGGDRDHARALAGSRFARMWDALQPADRLTIEQIRAGGRPA